MNIHEGVALNMKWGKMMNGRLCMQGEENVEFAMEVLRQMVVGRVIYGWAFDGVGQN